MLARAATVLQPRLVACHDGFLSLDLCRQMLDELRCTFWQPSGVLKGEDGRVVSGRSSVRRSQTSHQYWFSDDLNRHISTIEERIHRLFGVSPDRLEGWQATRYAIDDEYEHHLDAGRHGHEPAGEREYTFLLYLDAPVAGGATRFGVLDLGFEAVAGRLIAWRNLRPDGSADPFMLHTACPVIEGNKTTLVAWARQHATRSNGGEKP